jgi:uncharacterized membrane protein (DUF373 family)
MADEPEPVLPVRGSAVAERAVGIAETLLYVAVAALLIAAGVLTLVGTISDLFERGGSRPVSDDGLFILERVLLIFIVAELLYTLRLVNLRGRILVEPFLFIGLIAVVREILVVTAESQRPNFDVGDFIAQLGVLAGLIVALSLAIHVLRRSAIQQP